MNFSKKYIKYKNISFLACVFFLLACGGGETSKPEDPDKFLTPQALPQTGWGRSSSGGSNFGAISIQTRSGGGNIWVKIVEAYGSSKRCSSLFHSSRGLIQDQSALWDLSHKNGIGRQMVWSQTPLRFQDILFRGGRYLSQSRAEEIVGRFSSFLKRMVTYGKKVFRRVNSKGFNVSFILSLNIGERS